MQQLQGALVHVLRCQASHGQSGGQLLIHEGLAATAPDLLMLRDLASQVLAWPLVCLLVLLLDCRLCKGPASRCV